MNMSILPNITINDNYMFTCSKCRRKFTPQEDEHLLFLICSIGSCDWMKIAESMPGRSAKQCRDRYFNYLSEPQKKEPWIKEEDDKLLSLLSIIGPKWVEISKHLPGRSGNNVKNRWYKHLSKHFTYENGKLGISKSANECLIKKQPIEKCASFANINSTKTKEQYTIAAMLI